MSDSGNSEILQPGASPQRPPVVPKIVVCFILAAVPPTLVILGVLSAINGAPIPAGLLFSCAAIFFWSVTPLWLNSITSTYEQVHPDKLGGRIRLRKTLLPIYRIWHNSHYLATALSNLGASELQQADFEKAEQYFREALMIEEKTKSTKTVDRLFIVTANLANSLSRLNRYDEASALLEPCVEAVLSNPDRFAPSVGWFVVFSMLYVKTHSAAVGQAEARTYFQMTEEFFSRASASLEGNRLLEFKYAMLAATSVFYFKQNQLEDAVDISREFLNLARYRAAAVPLSELERFNEIAELLFEHKEFDLCEQFLDVAYRSGANEPFHPNSQRTLENFEKLLQATDRLDEIPDLKRWLRLVVALPPLT